MPSSISLAAAPMAHTLYFVMLRGAEKDLLKFYVDVLPHAEVVWAGHGEFIIDAPWYTTPKGFKAWDFIAVLKLKTNNSFLKPAIAGTHLQTFVAEVEPKQFKPSDAEIKDAEKMAPAHEPQGLIEVLHRNWHKVFSICGLARNCVRGARIAYWVAYFGLLKMKLWQGFHMLNLLKFDGDEKTYDLYRDEAGKLVMADGGSLAFLGVVKEPGVGFQEVMVVSYKHHFQFLKMALFTPSYWPLSMLRDEGLADGMLHATDPLL